VPTDRRMGLQFAPETPEVGYGQGRPTRALAAAIALGVGGTIAAILAADDPRTKQRLAGFRARVQSRRTTRSGNGLTTSARRDEEVGV
jgi:hypothetical protein